LPFFLVQRAAVKLGAIALVTGEIGAGKSTALRWIVAELHTITQFEGDSKPWLPIILVGQNNLADNLQFSKTSFPVKRRLDMLGSKPVKG